MYAFHKLTNAAGPNTVSYVNSDVLTAVFFSTTALNLTPETASTSLLQNTSGGTVCSGTCDVGIGWEYLTLGSTQYGTLNGISAAGFGIFGQSNFGGPSTNLDGADYGILPSNYPGGLGTHINASPLANNFSTFTLQVPQGFSLAEIDRVVFQYGTALTEQSLPGEFVPEPGTVGAFLGGVLRRSGPLQTSPPLQQQCLTFFLSTVAQAPTPAAPELRPAR